VKEAVARVPARSPFPFTFHVLPRRSISAEAGASERRRESDEGGFTHHATVTAELHRSCTVPAPFFENAFHYSLSPSHLQKPIRKMVQFLVDITP
jgi:hypothetical protein